MKALRVNWQKINWKKSNKELSEELNYTPESIYFHRKKCAPETVKKPYGVKVKDWSKIDWDKKDIEIARQYKVSRERVRQVRWRLRKYKKK